ncbi:MAG: hypothetical protein RI922_943 [Bacteroidota bacterium]|jgi:hypothetical protein
MKLKIVLFLGVVICSSCEIIWNDNKAYEKGGFSKLPCDNIDEIIVTNYPKEIDVLIKEKINYLYSNDTVNNYKIIGDVYHTMSLEDCVIDKTTYNFTIQVNLLTKREFWGFEIKKENNNFRITNHFKNPPNLIQ